MPQYKMTKKETAERSAFKKENRGRTASGREAPKKGMRQQEAPGKERSAKGSVSGRGRRGEVPRSQAPVRGTEREAKHNLCPAASKCGGCQWINKGYEEQLEMKSMKFRRLMEPYCRPEPIIPMESPNHYRNKVHAAFGEDRKHNAISGIYEEKSHRIVPVDRCLIENRKADEIIVSIRELLKSFKIRPYDEDTGRGLLRHVLVRVGHATGQIMVVLVLGYPVMPSKNNFVKALLKLHPEITTMVINVNDKDTSMILGEREQVIYGKGYIEDELCGMTFRISPKSFYQVNPVQTGKLYGKAMEYAGLTGKETVLDAYCGTGTIGMIASRQAGKVLGVELNKDAVRDAVSNGKRNGISNIRFYQADAGEFLLELAAAGEKLDVLFMDPPRSGSSEAFLNAAAKIGPKRIVYISCNPDTLVEDLRILKKKGYGVERAVAVDMFPYTDAIEAVVALSL
ncbi:MAG: 23S rRNA (uracil(1939)-C(5))-methyltransferase RlmD [Lachnospiraceae bacterium]|nr:23S rRNA (uracil(1939)-C(5))-methyltransferase RlmD [Lachnospiraceae bacterium]